MDFTTHVAFEEAVLGSQGTFIASHATLTHWYGAKLVFVETVIGSRRARLASHGAVIGLQRTSVVSTETFFQEAARGALATLTFMCLRTRGGLVLPAERSCSNFLGQSE